MRTHPNKKPNSQIATVTPSVNKKHEQFVHGLETSWAIKAPSGRVGPGPLQAEKLAFTISEAAFVSGIGRTTLYELMKIGELRALKLGRKTLIPADALRDFLRQLPGKSD